MNKDNQIPYLLTSNASGSVSVYLSFVSTIWVCQNNKNKNRNYYTRYYYTNLLSSLVKLSEYYISSLLTFLGMLLNCTR